MQFLFMTEQTETIDQPDQSKIMVAVQMGYKYMGDLAAPDLVIDQLDLGALATIDQVIIAIQCHHLAGRVTVECRYSRIIAKDRDSEHAVCVSDKAKTIDK